MCNIKLVSCGIILLGVVLLYPGSGWTAGQPVGTVQPRSRQGEVVSFSLPINVREASLYAGPGSNFYVTGTLAQNEQVEIFLRRADGWCAVRPPEGSFSWVNANFVRRESDQIGVITQHETEKEVPVRVGTDSVVKSSVIQVGLKNGKRVRIIGETKLPGGAAWYKIVPPAGEFRWIQDTVLLQDEMIKQLPAKITMTREYLDSYMEANTAGTGTVAQNSVNSPAPSPQSKANIKEDKSNAPAVTNPGNDVVMPKTRQGIIMESASGPSSGSGNRDSAVLPFSIPPMAGSVNNGADNSGTDEYSMEIARVNRDLFTVVNGGGNAASLAILSDRAKALFSAANSDEQRLAAKNVYDRIEQIKAGQFNLSSGNLAAIGPQGKISTSTNPTPPENKDKRFIKPRQRVVRPEKTSDSPRMGFAFSSKNKSTHNKSIVSAPVPTATPGNTAARGDGATAPGARVADTRTEGRSHGRGKPMFGTSSGPTTVPPHDYHFVAPPSMILPGPDLRGASGPLQDKASTNGKPPFMAEGQKPVLPGPALVENASIRQVSATVPTDKGTASTSVGSVSEFNVSSTNGAPSDGGRQRYDITSWRPPASLSQASTPQVTHTTPNASTLSAARNMPMATVATASNRFSPISSSQPSSQGFDAMGILGHLPAKPQGYPPYVLVEKNGAQMNIICYVQAESGQSLDRFVGKTIGVKGTRGWLKGEGENRMVLTAKTIFALK